MPERIQHDEDCLPGDRCVECGGCDCPFGIPPQCDGPGCQSVEDHDQWCDENGYEECPYGCH